MADDFQQYTVAPDGPADRWVAIVPSDTVPLVSVPRAISNEGTSGTVTIVGKDGVPAAFYIAQGQDRPLRARLVLATGISAGMSLRALY